MCRDGGMFMAKQVKQVYRFFAWIMAILLASGTFIGCRKTKYGAPSPIAPKYGPPISRTYDGEKGNVN
jgi:hypothetical protein